MVSPVNSTSPNIKSSIFYINDIHGQIPRMEQITNAATNFDSFTKTQKVDALKLCSGDTFIGSDEKTNKLATIFLDIAGISASAIGNHEFDNSASKLAPLINNTKTKFLGLNMNLPENSALNNKILKSTIITENGHQYGIIGIQPQKLIERMKKQDLLEGITIDNESQTIKELQEEVNNLKAKGINKIILVSHAGYAGEKTIAQSVSGIDIILGGHSHDLIEGIKEGKNLFYSPTKEPVIITQAGRDGNNFGILNVEYNNKGLVVQVQNNIAQTDNYDKSLLMSTMTDKILGESPKIGQLKYADNYPKKPLIEENPYANFVADAIKKEMNVDIVMINSGNFRGSLTKGILSERDISSIFPFKNKLCKVELTEKELVDALNHGGTSLTTPDNKPNILQVSGLTYVMNKNGKVIEANFISKDGKIQKIDVNNPNPNKKYLAIYDDFLCEGGDKFTMLKKMDSALEHYTYDKDKPTIDYIKKLNNQPFEIRKDGRIKTI